MNNTPELKQSAKGLYEILRSFLSELLNIRTNTDMQATKESIIADIPFKGHTSWILICSIFIASIGLNANSTAVVIGAMLISPLMGPILGLGFSLATNDIDLLNRSLKNFMVMVGLSVVTAFLFFWIFPLRDESSELLARVKPDIRDVLIAFFGGTALVIARARKGTMASVIFGVAIATALMPPLCTVGFGLAIGNASYALGALYLFLINTIFIAIATFLVIKYLRFPMERYANSARRRTIARIASVSGIVVMIPATYTFYGVLQESLFKRDAQAFLRETVESYPFDNGGIYRKEFATLDYNKGDQSEISVMLLGAASVPEEVITTWRIRLQSYERLKETLFEVIQSTDADDPNSMQYVLELYENKKSELSSKEDQIKLLENEIIRLKESMSLTIPFNAVTTELVAAFPEINRVGYSARVQTDFSNQDTLPVFEIDYNQTLTAGTKEELNPRIKNWLKARLQLDTLLIRSN
jgi:uncharacterized hydrophobic protein (TIGR00271 family)